MSDDLPDVLRDLVVAERAAPVATPAAQAAVRAKLGATLGIGKVAAVAAVATKTTLVLKTIAVIVTAGAIARTVLPSRAPAPTPAHVVERPVAESAVSAPTPTPVAVETPQPPPAAPVPAARLAAPREAPQVPAQAQLLAQATRALNAGDAARALVLLQTDQRHHADGPLREERDALRVSALLALGRAADAAELARDVLARDPHTLHRALYERALPRKDSDDQTSVDSPR